MRVDGLAFSRRRLEPSTQFHDAAIVAGDLLTSVRTAMCHELLQFSDRAAELYVGSIGRRVAAHLGGDDVTLCVTATASVAAKS